MSVAECQSRVSATEFVEWCIFMNMETQAELEAMGADKEVSLDDYRKEMGI